MPSPNKMQTRLVNALRTEYHLIYGHYITAEDALRLVKAVITEARIPTDEMVNHMRRATASEVSVRNFVTWQGMIDGILRDD